MNMSGMNAILAIVIILTILPVCTQAIPMPHSIVGTVYLSDGVTQAPAGTNFNVTDTTSGDYTPGTTGSGPNSGGYATTIDGEDGDTVIVNAWNATHYGTTTITLSGAMTGIDVIINIPSADTTPPASVSDLDETDKGTTWILWGWTNPSDSDFSHTKVYINGVFTADVNTPGNSYNAAGLSSGTTYEIGTRTVDDSGNMNPAWVNDTAMTSSEADTTPPASVSDLDETDKGTTWILWGWTNPSDSDFSHTKVYINGVFTADVNTPGNSYNAAGLSPGTTYEIGTRTVDNSDNMNTEWINDTATTLSSAAPSAASSSVTGAPIDLYRVDANVYATGSGFATGTNVDIYVVQDRDWGNGDQIPADVTGSVETVSVVNGGVGPVLVWHASLVVGDYDIVIDANRNGVYDASIDGLDSGSPGFVVIDMPSVPVPALAPIGIIALIGLLCVIGTFMIGRRFN